MKIFATEERQKILDSFGLKYKLDQDLNFRFENKNDERIAVKVLKGAFAL